MNYEFIKEIDSTNNELRRRSINNFIEHGFCLSADYQSNGHGQATNHWESERGKNLLFSVLLHPSEIVASQQFVITEFVTLAIVNALMREIDDEITIKWPNDIYVEDRKICGILIENTLCGAVIDTSIIGVGININQEAFVSDAPNPVSLKQISGRNHDRDEILNKINKNIIAYYNYLAANVDDDKIRESLHRNYMSHLYRRKGYHSYCTPDGSDFSAMIIDIGPQGHLSLQLKNGDVKVFAFKEVIFINDKL